MKSPTASQRRPRWRALASLLIAATALSGAGLAISPASADTGTSGSASATVSDLIAVNGIIHIEGTGWTNAGDGGSTIAVKLDSGSTEPASGPPTNPATGTPTTGLGLWAAVDAAADGSFSADIAFPTTATTNPAISAGSWAVGTTHHLRLLTGVLESGDPGRSVQLNFSVAPPLTGTGTSAASGEVTVALSGSGFTAGEVISATLGETPLQWAAPRGGTASPTYTVPAAGTLSGSVVIPAGIQRAGAAVVSLTGDQGTDRDVAVTVAPYISFGGGTTLGSSGTLTLGNLPAGAVIDSVQLGDTQLAGPLTASEAGQATAPYALDANGTPGTLPLVITQSAPTAFTYTSTQKVSPDPTPFNDGQFKISSNGEGIFQGLYQSAYSPEQDALYVTSASGTGVNENGFLYRLDPHTLAIEDSVQPEPASSGGRPSPYGVGVDDVNGTVWITNTRTNNVAVYDADDLSLLEQHPAGTISHPRDALYDPATNRVFVSSASEGASGNGYISVFEGGDNDGDGTPYEKIADVQTGARTDYSPMSLALHEGTLVSPSLQSNKVAFVDTTTLVVTFLTIDGINVGGRGASGIAFDGPGNRLFVASQNSDEVVIADATTGATIKEVSTGAGALNVAWDAVHEVAYVTNFGSTNVTVLDEDGTKIANLPIARANHVSVDGRGNAFVVDKNTGNKVWKITPKWVSVLGDDVVDPTNAGATASPDTTPLAVTATYGESIHLDGEHFVHPNGTGSTIGIKLDSTGTQPAAGPVTNPVTGNPFNGVYAITEADDLGTWSVDLPFPTADNVNDAAAAWAVGSTHHVRLLTGSLEAGDTGRTLAIKVTVAPRTLTHGTPTISGTPRVDKVLTAKPGIWTTGATLTYQWKRAGVGIPGATRTTYIPVAADTGKRLTVVVTGSAPTYETASVTSAATAVVAKGVLTGAKPKIAGTLKVGKKAQAKAGAWTAGARLTYQWFANGKKINGATKQALALTKALQGKRLTVVVTGTKAGYAATSKTSAKSAPVKKR